MPTKFLVIETPNFQLGANTGEKAEKIEPSAFPVHLKQHHASNTNDLLFVLAPEELRYNGVFNEAMSGPGSVSVAFFPKVEDAIRFLPSIFFFASEQRSVGIKDSLIRGSTIYNENIFNGNNVGGKLDPVFAFARRHLSSMAATNAWGSIQSLVFHGLQNLPEQGEKGTGEKVDVQIGADEKIVLLTVRFDLPQEQGAAVRGSPLVALPKSVAGIFESRYMADAKKIEFNCLFYRDGAGPARPIEIQTFHRAVALENPDTVKDYSFRILASITGEVTEEKKVVKAKGGFKKKFSEQIEPAAAAAESASAISASTGVPESKVVVSGNAKIGDEAILVRSKAPAAAEISTTVKGGFVKGEKETIVIGGASTAELELKIKGMETTLRQKDEMIAKLNKDLAAATDPHSKRDVLSSIKDSQSEGLKQTVKSLEAELEEAKEREKELMKMVDKAVQMKDEAAKKIKELDLKVKQAGGAKGSKEQMLEKQIEEAKRQNKELAARLGEMMAKQRTGKAA